MKITTELIFSGQSINGGWSRAQFEELGLSWPPYHGWIKKIVGREIPDSSAERFLELKDAHIEYENLEYINQKEHIKSIQQGE